MASGLRLLVGVVWLLIIAQLRSCDGNDNFVPPTLLADAVPKRAVCIDGSPSGYHHARGFGDGVNNWIVYLMGGGWCSDNSTCQERRNGPYGSTTTIQPKKFNGLLSSNQDINPDFYNWNIVFVYYCDGSSFLGDIDLVNFGPDLQFRGSRIFDAVIDELLAKGMKAAENVLFGGRSAGGLATILHCDRFRARLPNVNKIKCLSDSGFFIRAKNVANAEYREWIFSSIINFHNLTNLLPKSCTSRMNPGLCFFAEYLVRDIQTPLFLLNSAFDLAEIQVFLKPNNSGDLKGWKNCIDNLTECTNAYKELIHDFGNAFRETLMSIGDDNPSRGLFINSCYIHVFSERNELWNSIGSPRLGNKTISQAVGDWFFDRSSVKLIDTHTNFPFNCPM
ncbi:hypothetical protein C2S52_008521 [Perilla frutescens var. hirtella]|nr:hypothetical protein C2S51_017764 [Perilla frutescens var. frutescens]KAH6783562.1 hypothetical protein C2S52_008521 [Perilla frutescens var. hirtella]